MTGSTDRPIRGAVRHTLIYGVGNASVAILGLILVPIYTHHLAPAEYGLLALVLALYGFLGRIYDLGMTNAVARVYFDVRSKDQGVSQEVKEMATTSVAFLAVYALVLSGLLWSMAGPLARLMGTGESGPALIRIIAFTLLTDAAAIVPLTLIRMQERTAYFVAATSLRFMAALILNIWFVVYLGWGVGGILLGGALTSGALLLFMAPEIRSWLTPRLSKTLLRELLSFGLPFLPVPLCIWAIDYSDRYILERGASIEEVGWYSLGHKLAQVVQLAVTAFSMGWAPLRYQVYEREDAREIYRTLTTYFMVVCGTMVVGLGLFSRQIVALVAPEEYSVAAGVVAPLGTAYLLYGLFVLMVTGMGVTKRTGPMAVIAVTGAVVNIGLNLLLIPRFGMYAAAGTTVLANGVLVWGSWYFSQKVYPIPYDWRAMAKLGGLMAGFFALDWLLFLETLGLQGLVGAAGLFTLFLVLLRVVELVTASDLQRAMEWGRAMTSRAGSGTVDP
ncbi:MAG: oligosaccharide flippase family protein [Gemmatimonadota bacterium]